MPIRTRPDYTAVSQMAITSPVKVRVTIRIPKRLLRLAQLKASEMAAQAGMPINLSEYLAILIAAQEEQEAA